jgi:hypothetical protein
MAGISNIGNSYLDRYNQLLEQALGRQEEPDGENVAVASLLASETNAAAKAEESNDIDSIDIKEKVRLAIMAAVREAENSGEDSDLLSVISNAVKKTLKAAGIDPAKALDSDKVDDSTKAILKALDKITKAESNTLQVFSAMEQQSNDLFSILGNQSNQNLSGYLFDSTQ